MSRILALDQGTTSSRSILVDPSGELTKTTQQEFEQIFPQPGWVEHDAEIIWQTQLETARQCANGQDISAIGITNQRETTVIWNRETGKPITNAIVWQDRRTSGLCQKLRDDGLEKLFVEKTGLIIDPYFSATKIRWLLDNVDGARKQAEAGELAFGTIDSWLVWKLTKGAAHITDHTNASRTMLYNIHTGEWDDELLDIMDIPKSLLPKIVSSSACSERSRRGELAVADKEWFGKEIPICGIAGDQQAALFGQACFKPGMIKNTYGTGCFLVMNTGDDPVASENKLLTTPAWNVSNHITYALEGSVFSAGSVVQWLRDGLGIIKKSSDIEGLANSVKDSGGIVLVPAFTGLGAPVWDADARGLVIGITRGTTNAHIARAVLECIAFQVADVVNCMKNDTDISLTEIRVDGGASVNSTLLQFQADILGIPVARPACTETTALGAALLAGLGAGLWSSMSDLAKIWKVDRTFEPDMNDDEREERIALWHKARERSLHWE